GLEAVRTRRLVEQGSPVVPSLEFLLPAQWGLVLHYELDTLQDVESAPRRASSDHLVLDELKGGLTTRL
ncbi:NADH-quinone oxidoreductase subunit D, partial [Frankliniella fusca]